MAEPTIQEAMNYLRIDPAQLAKEQAASNVDAKKWVWIPTAATVEAGYVAAEVKSANGDMVTVETQKGDVSIYLLCFCIL